MTKFEEQLTAMILTEFPGVVSANPEDIARASMQLSAILGCTLASVLLQKGEATFEAVLARCVAQVVDNAAGTANRAAQQSVVH